MALLRCARARSGCALPVLLASLVGAVCMLLRAETPKESLQEYQVKAAYLYHIAKFVEWPPPATEAGGPLVVVVFGRDPFGPILEHTLWGKSINNRPVVVRRAGRVGEVMPCHVLFVGRQERRRLAEVLAALEGLPVLTVGEDEDFLEQGGAVKLVAEDNRVRFEINLGAARRSGLNISSKLLTLARTVKR